MKIAGCVIRKIKQDTEDTFEAEYKGKRIYVTTEHGFGEPKYDHLRRFLIDVIDIKTGMYDVQSYDDFHTMRGAIICALRGAKLIY